MRGIGQTLSRLPAARAMVVGAAMLAGAAFSAAHGQTEGIPDQTAMAVPRLAPPGSTVDVVLPEPLTPSDAARIRRIFRDQAHGRLADAERDTAALDSDLLAGTILADRYLGRFHRSTPEELEAWLKRYADQPEALAIRALLRRRLPKGAAVPAATALPFLAVAPPNEAVPEETGPAATGITRNKVLDREVTQRLRDGHYTTALRLIGHTRGLGASYGALLRAEVARALFTANRDTEAARVATAAWHRPPAAERVGNAAFLAGLAEWRLGQIEAARRLFIAAMGAPIGSESLRAAAGYWAARASTRLHDANAAVACLRAAAREGHSFYALIARRSLGWPLGLLPGRQTLSEADLDALSALPRGLRAFALLQVGQIGPAEQELRYLWPEVKDDPALRHALLLVATRARLTDFAAQIAELSAAADGVPIDKLRFPVPRLRPRGGFRVDPALVYGMTRAESNFDPNAVSPAGARGLMQLMPTTARSVAGNPHLPAERLADPGYNLELGQRWVQSLAREDQIDGNLIALLASYNAGLGSYGSWAGDIGTTDPLLFIEAIPIDETRNFVHRALAYTWLFAARLGLAAPSLDEVIAGEFPRFTPAAEGSTVLVSYH